MVKDNNMEEVRKVRFIYIPLESNEKHFINGAYGGLTPRGEIICNFFFEYRELPDSEEATFEGDKLNVLIAPITEPEIIREIKCSIIMNPAQARSIAKWLVEKADDYDKHFGGKNIELPETEH